MGSAVESESAKTPGKDVEEDAGKRDKAASKVSIREEYCFLYFGF